MLGIPEHGVCECDKHFEVDEFLKSSSCIKSIIDDLVIICDDEILNIFRQ